MKRPLSPVPDSLPTPKRLRSPLSDRGSPPPKEHVVNGEQPPELEGPTPSRAEYWDPVIKELRFRQQPRLTDMGGLPLIDVRLAIANDKRFPPSYELNEGEWSSLRKDFGETVIEELDALVGKLAPSPDEINELQAAVEEFDDDPTGIEPKLAGSELDRMVNPFDKSRVQRANGEPSIAVKLSQQSKLYSLTARDSRAYIFPLSSDMTTYVSATRIYDHGYSLMSTVCDQDTLKRLNHDKRKNHFPCFSPDYNTLPPFATGEVKVLGHYRKQREQQEVYATFYVTSWMMLRALMKGKDHPPVDDLLKGINHCCFSMSPSSLEIWDYRPIVEGLTGDLHIQAQLLCSGHPCDEAYMKEVYIPWRRYVMKRGIINQILHLVPAIQAYAQLPEPRPFAHSASLFLLAKDLKPGSYNLEGLSFSTAPSMEREVLQKQLTAHEEAVRLAAKMKKKRKNMGGLGTASEEGTESQSPSSSFSSVLARLPSNLS